MAVSPQSDDLSHETAVAGKKAADAAQRTAEEGARAIKSVGDFNGRAARASAEIMQRNSETLQHALQSSARMAAQMGERSTDHLGRTLGLTGENAEKAAEKSASNLEAILQSSTVLAEVTGSISREWFSFANDRIEQNMTRLENLIHCRSPHDFAALHSEILRNNLEALVEFARKAASQSARVAEETGKRVAETTERGLHAA
jgi:hypothetical protein